jgi:Flp pilus assembly protein TadG
MTLPLGGRKRAGRRAAAAVEFAVVAPLLFLLLLGMFEFGRMLMVQQILTNGAREGARRATLPGSTQAAVSQRIDGYLAASGVAGHTAEVSPDPTTAASGAVIKVTLTVPYKKVSWLPPAALGWLEDGTLTASVEMRKEEY